MALEPISILFGILDILRIALIFSIPLFIAAIPSLALKNLLAKKYNLNWIQSALLATYLALTAILIFLYLLPYYFGFIASEIAKQTAPVLLELSLLDMVSAVFFTIIRLLGTGLLLTILVLPLEFLAEYFSDLLKEKKIPGLLQKFIVSYCISLVVTIIILFVFPWIWTGIIYLIYWG